MGKYKHLPGSERAGRNNRFPGGNQHTKKRKDRTGIDLSKRKKYALGEKCLSCETPLGLKGGYAGTGLCGPCCTGDAETITEFLETW